MKKLVSCFLVVMLILNMLPVGLFAKEEIQPDIEKNSLIENDSEVGLDLETKENLSNEDSLEITPLQIPQKEDAVAEVLPVSEAVGDVINFPDQNLFNGLISNGVDQNNDGVITQEEMKKREGLISLDNQQITNLSGLEYATAIDSLQLYGNTELSNIDPIKSLTQLDTLDLRETKVSDADRMSFLHLEDQTCTTGFSKYQVIKPLGISDAYTVSSSDESVLVVSKIDNYCGETKVKMDAKKAGTSQVSVSIGTETKEFTVTVNAPLEGTIQFPDANLYNALINQGVDQNNDGAITQEEMKQYGGIYLNDQNITNLSGMEYATELSYLSLNGNTDLVNIEPIRGLTKLETLDLGNTGVSDADKMSFMRLSDQTCTLGFSTYQIIQPYGLSDAYSVSSSDESVVVASIDKSTGESRIKMDPKKIGTAKISVGIGTEIKTFNLTVSPTITGRIPGDVDGNGKVSAFDGLMALQIATGKKDGTSEEITAGDVGNSGTVEAFDALRILQFATGKITEF